MSISKPVKHTDGSLRWYDEQGRLHNDSGPAIIAPDGGEVYYREDLLHRTDGPAMHLTYQSQSFTRHEIKRYFINNVEYTETEFNFWKRCHEASTL